MREIQSLQELKDMVGQQVATSDWVEVAQERVNMFAEATGDHQWIHIDVERAKRESPFGAPIAHGFLTLSLLPALMQNAIHLSYVKMGVNYGLNKVRFPAPVPVGSQLRAHLKLLSIEDIKDGAQMTWEVSIERAGSDKPVCVAESIARCY
ncbi:MaoC family dehydratase [Undibacterium jejuense]|uniref:MaoC family dehydratase n=1 Tax=Undibacterium jejuense TaxID=1344949 RepID=A0A923HP41_9BURK|nr:MaoC family dehydratase [Undibacterium jejuense]MBC3862178.1 MaoC family dehydratase [Undibacterium jejuense]